MDLVGVSQHPWDPEHVKYVPERVPERENQTSNRKYDADRVLGVSQRVKTRDDLRTRRRPTKSRSPLLAAACFLRGARGILRCFK